MSESVPFVNPGYAGKRKGVRNPRWRNGYIEEWCPARKRYVYQHRLVMETALGRHLETAEVVHHIDGNRLNNKLENLEYHPSRASHIAAHVAEGTWGGKGKKRPQNERSRAVCPICGSIFKPHRRTLPTGEQADTATCSQSCGQTLRQQRPTTG